MDAAELFMKKEALAKYPIGLISASMNWWHKQRKGEEKRKARIPE
jgi:hypothetical protein